MFTTLNKEGYYSPDITQYKASAQDFQSQETRRKKASALQAKIAEAKPEGSYSILLINKTDEMLVLDDYSILPGGTRTDVLNYKQALTFYRQLHEYTQKHKGIILSTFRNTDGQEIALTVESIIGAEAPIMYSDGTFMALIEGYLPGAFVGNSQDCPYDDDGCLTVCFVERSKMAKMIEEENRHKKEL